MFINKFPDRDIVILQATATEIKDSIINEIEKFLNNSGYDVGDDITRDWYIPKSKIGWYTKGNKAARTFIRLRTARAVSEQGVFRQRINCLWCF